VRACSRRYKTIRLRLLLLCYVVSVGTYHGGLTAGVAVCGFRVDDEVIEVIQTLRVRMPRRHRRRCPRQPTETRPGGGWVGAVRSIDRCNQSAISQASKTSKVVIHPAALLHLPSGLWPRLSNPIYLLCKERSDWLGENGSDAVAERLSQCEFDKGRWTSCLCGCSTAETLRD